MTRQQLNVINRQLTSLQLHPQVQEEILDHVATLTEDLMSTGYPFDKAVQQAFVQFEKDEIQDINQSIVSLQKKNTFMKVLVLSCTAISLAIASFFHFSNFLIPSKPAPAVILLPELPIVDPPSTHPVPGHQRQTAGFGKIMHPIKKVLTMHTGIDIAAPLGTPVVATADGTVKTAKSSPESFGLHIVISHDDSFSTFYAHLSELKVEVGQQIKKGDVIGLVGSTGLSTGPHLHYEIRKDGAQIDPAPYLHP